MRIAAFARLQWVAFRDLAAGDLYFGGVDGNDLYMKTAGIPNPDPATGLGVRVGDGFINGIGLDTWVYRTEGTLEPDGCEPPYACDPVPLPAPVPAPAPAPPPAPTPAPPPPAAPPAPAAPAPRRGAPVSPAKVAPPAPPSGRRPRR
jgi:hypothetical protein